MAMLVAGFGIAMLVSIPPGANTALCVSSARGGARSALPVIAGAAATDIVYALLAAAGLMAVSTAGVIAVHLLAAGFCVVGAALLWRRRTPAVRSRAAFSLALFNPATAVLWIGLSAMAIAHPHGTSATLLWVLGVGAGTTTWFSLLAFASSRMHRRLAERQTFRVQRAFSGALLLAAVLLVV